MEKKPLSERIGTTKEKITKVGAKTGVVSASLTNAQKRWKHYHDLAVKTYAESQKAQDKADKLRQKDQPEKAAELDSEGMKLEAQSMNAHTKAQEWIGKVKKLKQRQEGLENTDEMLRARLEKLREQKGPKVKGNKVVGGTPDKRLQLCMLTSAARCAKGTRTNFYSQVGAFDVQHSVTGPSRDHRDDCSSWFTAVYWSCGLPDPGGTGYTGAYTGYLGKHGKEISREEAKHTPMAAVLFGTGEFDHVEAAIGDGTEHTIGHGSGPVDMGTFDLLPGPVEFRKYPHS